MKDGMIPDSELIARWKEGEERGIEQLLERYESRIFSYLFRMTANRHDAEEAVQETFVKVIRSLKRYREEGHFRSWIFRIAHREGLRTIRSGKRVTLIAPEDIIDPTEMPDPAMGPDEEMVNREQQDQIVAAIDQLPEAEKQVVLLRLYSDLPFKEIADIMKCPLGTALGRMRNASARLRQTLSGKDL